jgi:WD40 repeat protein
MVFLETSKKAYDTEQLNKELLQKRQLRRSRRIAFVSAAAAIIGLGLVIFSFIKANEAEKQTVLAQEAAQKAETAQEQAQESAAKAIAEAARADIAAKEADKQAAIALEQAEIAEQEKQNAQAAQRRAELSQQEALVAQKDAEEQRAAAEVQRQEAVKAQEEAEVARAAADRLRYQAIAQSMAIKAVGVRDTELKALVAKQGYDYYQEFKDEGKDYNGDIYAGVFSALKGLEGDSLNLWVGHTKSVRSVAYNSDGSKMYSAGADGKILAWDMTNDNRSFTEVYSQPDVNRVVGISPDERYLAIGVGSGTDEEGVMLYNVQNPEEAPITVAGHGGEVFDLVFLPDGKGFISTGADGTIKKNDFSNTTTIGTFKQRMKSLAVSPDGSTLAGGNEEGNVLLWDLNSTDQDPRTIYVRRDEQRTNNPVSAVEFNRDGTILAFGDEQGNVVIYDMVNETEVRTLTNHATRVTDLEFSHNNQLLATSSTDGTADIWNMANLNDLPTILTGHNDWVWGVSFDPDNEHLVTAGRDGNVRLWPTKADEYAARLCGHDNVSRNMGETEWAQYVGEDIDYQITCEEYEKSSEQ